MAKIEKKEIGFPMGETIKAITSSAKVSINPDKDAAGDPKETGEIIVSFKYEEATVRKSTGKPLDRMFSICNKNEVGDVFHRINDISVEFATNSKKTVSPLPQNAHKELKIIINGEGFKKNSFGTLTSANKPAPKKKKKKK
jgi:hypothetical protein